MKYTINKQKGSAPAYLQLYSSIRQDIIDEVYKFNSKLPSKRTIAEELNISTITVEHAYSLLQDEGYIEAKERSGYFVCFTKQDNYLKVSPQIIKTKSTPVHTKTNLEFPFSVLAKTMRQVLSIYGQDILTKSDNMGLPLLKEAIKDYLYRARGVETSYEQIIIGAGSEYLYGLIIELLSRDKTYAIESPSYKKIEEVYKAAKVNFIRLPLSNDGISSEHLKKASADVLHVSPYRSFPSGVTASASKRHEYLRWAQNNKYIIEDDFESEFSVSKKSEETLFSHTTCDNVIYMNTFSKTISPSIRVGYMVIPKHLVKVFKENLGFYSCTVPTVMQIVIATLINNGDFERHINRTRRKKRKELQK